ncbi:endosome/lysosome-associated apoptosis and autophagy regulator family member 2-like isoform X3 [Liolophura sinensis]|uniref:endosome/lysosome-associated apoptosis and autophagy regulator family member 2-like isoform X3 n=1 Tax=Liolophura sinensis TaxID=3198878 RepID=UPI003158A0F0
MYLATMAYSNKLRFAAVLLIVTVVAGDQTRTCQPEDFHYEYTECDSKGGRWRVSVPKPDFCSGGAPNPPVRGKDCSFTCDSGQFLDIQDQECHACKPGTYSLGGGIRYDDWTSLPQGFSVESESLGMSSPGGWVGDDKPDNKQTNCTDEGWRPEGDYVAVYSGPCSSYLVYSATLVKPGSVVFEYQFNDATTFFHFVAQNDKCQGAHENESSKWPSVCKKGEWKTVRVPLKTGVNVLYWKRVNFGGINHGPIFVRNIEIEGVAYTSQCSTCKEGTYSSEGATTCTPCDANTYSQRGAISCTPCNSATEYSRKGAARCEARPACTASDYYEYHTPCDDTQKTKISYKWIQPQICRTDLPNSVQLPAEGPPTDCPPCNPGMQMIENKGCQFCPPNQFSEGALPCKPCPGSTSPNNGYYYQWWNTMPPNITTACFTLSDDGCEVEDGWIPAGDHVHTGQAKVPDSYFILNVNVGQFRSKAIKQEGGKAVYGEVTFVFEMNCTGKCALSFAQESADAVLLQSWEGTQKRQEYKHRVTELNDYAFSFAFRPGQSHKDLGRNNFAKIYSIEVTNIGDNQGGARSCQSCPRGVQDNGCIPCPDGHFVDPNTTKCTPCPQGTVVLGDSFWGKKSCQTCGSGLQPFNGNKCASDCKFTNAAGREFDFTELGKYSHYIDGTRLFTSSGTKYVHGFNISLCAGHDAFPQATCVNNVTFEEAENGLGLSIFQSPNEVKGAVCRSTMIPARMNHNMVLSTQPASLGDYLQKIVTNASLTEMYSEEGFSVEGIEEDIHFYYRSDSSTAACKEGRTTIISLRCDNKEDGNGTIDLPPKCSDGTCDGCNFHFLWRTQHACPICKPEDYEVIVGECIRGTQMLHYVPPKHCVLQEENKPAIKERKCSMLPFAVEIGILAGIGVGIIMCGCLVYCWKKNRKLEYKYMKLVGQENSTGKYGEMELPGVDSCGLDEGEEEQFDAVHFKESKGKQLFNKLKLKIGGKDDDNPFESIALSEKQSLT